MSTFARSADTSHRLSLAAMEEASRVGLRTADIEHLLLALTIDRDDAGRTLRSHGLTLQATRAAIAAQHAAQLAVIGVSVREPEEGRIVFHETDGYEWSDRAQRIFTSANARGKAGDAVAVLRELLAEPSGLVEAILREAGANREAIERDLATLDASAPAARSSSHGTARRGTSSLAGTTEGFVPAPVADVWALLADPARMPEWQPSVASVAAHPDDAPREGVEKAADGATWSARATTTRPDGAALKVKEEFRRLNVTMVARDPEQRVTWALSHPDAPHSISRTIDVRLEPEGDGTRLRIAFAWLRTGARPRHLRVLGPILSVLLRPVHRFIIWVQLSQLVSSISRVFR